MVELLSTDVLHPDNLVIQEDPGKGVAVTFAIGAGTIARGTVLGMIAADETYVACDKTAEDGSQVARTVAKEAVVLSAQATVNGLVFGPGDILNEDAMTFVAGTVADDVREDLRTVGIIIKGMVDAQA